MDFHAVAEFTVDGVWRAVDATTLAPRASLLLIATRRDAADTALLTVLSGRIELTDLVVGAITDDPSADDLDALGVTALEPSTRKDHGDERPGRDGSGCP